MPRKPIFNKQYFIETRRVLRKNSTHHELVLWESLRSSKLGYRFKRQESIGRFIVDFYCPSRKLVVELDGEQHKSNIDYDKERTFYLNGLKIKVLRFWNNEVELNINNVIKKIQTELKS